MDALTRATFSEGDGVIARIVVDAWAFVTPHRRARLYPSAIDLFPNIISLGVLFPCTIYLLPLIIFRCVLFPNTILRMEKFSEDQYSIIKEATMNTLKSLN